MGANGDGAVWLLHPTPGSARVRSHTAVCQNYKEMSREAGEGEGLSLMLVRRKTPVADSRFRVSGESCLLG